MDEDLAIMKDVLDECFGESPKLFHRIESTNIFLYYHDSLVACSKVKKAQFDQMENVDLKFRLSAQSTTVPSVLLFFHTLKIMTTC